MIPAVAILSGEGRMPPFPAATRAAFRGRQGDADTGSQAADRGQHQQPGGKLFGL
jgi:hypothetical protein